MLYVTGTAAASWTVRNDLVTAENEARRQPALSGGSSLRPGHEYVVLPVLFCQAFERLHNRISPPEHGIERSNLEKIADFAPDRGLIQRFDTFEEGSVNPRQRILDVQGIAECARMIDFDEVPRGIEEQVSLILVDVAHEVVERVYAIKLPVPRLGVGSA